MPDISQQINIIATFQNKLSGMSDMINKLDKMKEAGAINNKEYKKSISTLQRSDKQLFGIAKKMNNFDNITKKSTKDFKEFGSAAKSLSITLPLMFGFQQASQSIQSLIQPAMDLVGVQKTYNDFLAIKYLPTALEQLENVLATGDAWDQQSEAQRKSEGDMLLLAQRTSDFITYAAQMATTLGAIGEILPTMHFEILGTGIEFTGRQMGAAGGVVSAITGGLMAMSTQAGITTALFNGFGAAVALQGTDMLGGLLTQIRATDSEGGLPSLADMLGLGERKTGLFSDSIITLITQLWNVAKKWVVDVATRLTGKEALDGLKNTLDTLTGKNWPIKIGLSFGIGGIIGSILKFLSGGGGGLGSIFKSLGLKIPGFKTGGIMPYTGLAMLHAGETITPAGQNINSSPNFYITANVANDVDVRQLATQLSKYWTSDYERITKQRGMI